MRTRPLARLSACVAALLLSSLCLAQEIVATPKNATGVYAVGEKIQWRLEVRGEGAADISQLRYIIKKGGLTKMSDGKLDLANGSGSLETSLDAPGTVLVELEAAPGGDKKPIKLSVGAAVAPDKIQPSAPCPADFDDFWKAKIAELNAVPANATLEPADSGKETVEYFKVRMDNIRGSHIYGQLARPKREGKFPAMLIVQWAGVYGLPKGNVVSRADAGWLALNIMSHDLPFDQDADFYKKAEQTTLKNYIAIGSDDREKSYFLRMYLSCYRAAEYLSQRPDWDGRVLVVTGTSQGGQQTLVTAGLHPKITAMMANVPAGCDTTGPDVGRAAGFPYWYDRAKGPDGKKIIETGRYFDAVNFAARIKCPALVSMGLIDVSCPPAGVLAACNQMQGPKEAVILVNSDHHGTKNAQAPYQARLDAWCKAMVQGQAPPVR